MQMRQGRAQSWCRCGGGEPSPGADVAAVQVIRCPEVYDTWQDIILWMNSGGGVSHLHFDTDENVRQR